MVAVEANRQAAEKVYSQLIDKAHSIFKEKTGKGLMTATADAMHSAIESGIDPNNTQAMAEHADVKAVANQMKQISEDVAKKAMALKGGQIAAISAATLAAVGLTVYGVHKMRNREKPVVHIDAATAQLENTRVQEAQTSMGNTR